MFNQGGFVLHSLVVVPLSIALLLTAHITSRVLLQEVLNVERHKLPSLPRAPAHQRPSRTLPIIHHVLKVICSTYLLNTESKHLSQRYGEDVHVQVPLHHQRAPALQALLLSNPPTLRAPLTLLHECLLSSCNEDLSPNGRKCTSQLLLPVAKLSVLQTTVHDATLFQLVVSVSAQSFQHVLPVLVMTVHLTVKKNMCSKTVKMASCTTDLHKHARRLSSNNDCCKNLYTCSCLHID
jgi:hypothetical protein